MRCTSHLRGVTVAEVVYVLSPVLHSLRGTKAPGGTASTQPDFLTKLHAEMRSRGAGQEMQRFCRFASADIASTTFTLNDPSPRRSLVLGQRHHPSGRPARIYPPINDCSLRDTTTDFDWWAYLRAELLGRTRWGFQATRVLVYPTSN